MPPLTLCGHKCEMLVLMPAVLVLRWGARKRRAGAVGFGSISGACDCICGSRAAAVRHLAAAAAATGQPCAVLQPAEWRRAGDGAALRRCCRG